MTLQLLPHGKKNDLARTVAHMGSAILLSTPVASVVMAQENSGAGLLEEVVVTAQKRSQSIQDIGFSVSAFNDADAARYAGDIGALAGQVPGVEAYGGGSYLQTFFVRGIGLNEFSGNYNAPVAIHKDEVYVSKNWMVARPSFDIDRIEILKGPQGTIFGRNTTGGAVNYYSKAPSEDVEGYVSASADEFSRYSLEGALNGALADNLNGRLSLYRGFGNGGPQDNLFTGDEHGEPDVLEVRGQLQWNLDETTVRLLAYGGSDQSETLGYKSPGIFAALPTGGFCPEALLGTVSDNPGTCFKFLNVTGDANIEREPNGIHTINQNNAPNRDDSFAGGYLRVEHDFGPVQLTSITAYDGYERRHREDSDGSPIASNDAYFYSDIDVFSQELRLSGSTGDDKVNYLVGVFYEQDDLRQSDFLDLSATPFNVLGAGLPPALFGEFDQDIDSLAIFTNLDVNITERWVLTLGGRYTRDSTQIKGTTGASLNDPQGKENTPATVLAVVDSIDDDRTDTDLSWRLGLSYAVNDVSLLYVNLATGFRTGGYSVPFGGTIVEFDPEELISYEIGYKSDLTDTVRLNLAAFFYQYDDLQVNVDDPVSPIVPITRNIGESETFGIEADLTWLPTDKLEIKLGYSYLDAEFTSTDRSMTTISLMGPISLEGNSPVNSPENQFNGSFKYANAINQQLGWSAQVDFRWVDDRFLEATNQPADAADAYTVVNASVGLASNDEAWDVSVWVKNLTDEEYLTYVNNLPGPGFKLDIFGEQRSSGVSARYNF